MTSVRAPTAEDISAKMPSTGTSTLETCDFIPLVVAPSMPPGVPSFRSNSLARKRYYRATSFWWASIQGG